MLKITLADDNQEVLRSLELLFSIDDGTIITGRANNCKDAIDQVRQTKPDLLIIDLEMNWANGEDRVEPQFEFAGCEAIKFIREFDQNIPIYVLTVHDYLEAKQAALKSGANHIFIKGRDTRLLMSSVNNLKSKK